MALILYNKGMHVFFSTITKLLELKVAIFGLVPLAVLRIKKKKKKLTSNEQSYSKKLLYFVCNEK